MSKQEILLTWIKCFAKPICDDCLRNETNIKPRQQVNFNCRKLNKDNIIKRSKDKCYICKNIKLVNYIDNNIEYKDNMDILQKSDKKISIDNVNLDNLNFVKVDIVFEYTDKVNIFYNLKKPLKEIINKPKYSKFKSIVIDKYSDYLDYPIGKFLKYLKESKDDTYKMFLNQYGDLNYCKFKINNENISRLKGLYLYKVNGEIHYIGRCLDSFKNRINMGYGNICPKNCYIDGRSTNCRINNLINLNYNNIELLILDIADEETIKKFEIDLIKKYKPAWNIAGK